MSEINPSSGPYPNLAEAFDWRARRTWGAFAGLGLVFGFASGSLGIASTLLVKPHFPTGPGVDVIGSVLAFAFHFPALYLLYRLDCKSLPKDDQGRLIERWRLPNRMDFGDRRVLPLFLAWTAFSIGAIFAANEIGLRWFEAAVPMAGAVNIGLVVGCWQMLMEPMRCLVPGTTAKDA